jgi:two-component system nitrate/nitrite response regulator NarL
MPVAMATATVAEMATHPVSDAADRSAADSQPTSIAFVDDHPTLLAGIASLFADDRRYSIAGTASSADGAVELAASGRPDIMTLDLSMPGDVFSAIRSIAECSPSTRMVIFTAYADVDMALRALDAGAHAFVLKGRPSEDLFAAIETVKNGGLFVSPDFSPMLIGGFRNRARRERERPAAKLSAREQQLLQGLFEAKTNKEIARALGLTEKTVKHYMTNLMTKLKVKSRLEVVLAAKRLGSPYNIETLVPDEND